MRPLQSFNLETLDTYSKSLQAIETQIRELILLVKECDDNFTDDDKKQLIANIQWLKRFYESAERNLLNDK
jgi:hypothetical protein